MKKIILLALAFVAIGGGFFLLERQSEEEKPKQEKQERTTLYDDEGKAYVFSGIMAAKEFQELNGIMLKSLCFCYSKGEKVASENLDSLLTIDKFAVCDTTLDDLYRIELFNQGYRAFIRLDSLNIHVNSLSAFDTAAQYISKGQKVRVILDTCYAAFLTSDGLLYQAETAEDLQFFERKLNGTTYLIQGK